MINDGLTKQPWYQRHGLYNMSGKLPSGHVAARVAFAGYLLMAIGNFGCMYLLGLDPDRVQ